tara:strand:- start:2000 stop:2680 length:681 start_codon:yes stop_codon:yes gene_type:complete
MAKVFIQPDSDGDLHTAAMHNNKFQVILNEINGNLDEKNLKYPNSIFTLESDAGLSSEGFKVGGYSTEPQRYPVGWMHIAGGPVYIPGFGKALSTVQVLQNSFYLAERAFKVERVVFGLMKSSTFVAGQTWTVAVETSSGVTAASTWSTVAQQASIDLNSAGGFFPVMYNIAPSAASIPANNYLRVTLTTPSGAWGEYINAYADVSNLGVPPPIWCKIICSTQHVA